MHAVAALWYIHISESVLTALSCTHQPAQCTVLAAELRHCTVEPCVCVCNLYGTNSGPDALIRYNKNKSVADPIPVGCEKIMRSQLQVGLRKIRRPQQVCHKRRSDIPNGVIVPCPASSNQSFIEKLYVGDKLCVVWRRLLPSKLLRHRGKDCSPFLLWRTKDASTAQGNRRVLEAH